MSSTISICNQKGGVGKTTTAINLSAYVSLKGYRVLLVDMDPQGNATSGLGINKRSLSSTIYEVLTQDENISNILIDTDIEALKVVPANLKLTGAGVELINMFDRERRLSTALEKIREDFDYIFIDCPPSLGILTINALASSQSILIPLQCEFYALEGITQLLNTIKLIKGRLNPNLEIEGFLLTMADKRTKLTSEVAQEAKSYFNEKLYSTVIPRNIKLSEAPGFGKPIALYDKECSGAQKYGLFADEFLHKRANSEDVLRGTSEE